MQLIEVRDKKTENAFFNVCNLIYTDDKNYIPHLRQDLEKIFDPEKNKLFRQGGEAIRWILNDKNGKTIGRVAAFIHPKTSKTGKHKLGGMGFFECTNNKEAANILLNASKDWLISKEMEGMDGPINFGEKDNFWGLLTENFTAPPSYGMTAMNPRRCVRPWSGPWGIWAWSSWIST